MKRNKSKIERYINNEAIPHVLDLQLKDKVRFNCSRNWYTVIEVETYFCTALLRRNTKWGPKYAAILTAKTVETEDLYHERWIRYFAFEKEYDGPALSKQKILTNTKGNVYSLDIKRS